MKIVKITQKNMMEFIGKNVILTDRGGVFSFFADAAQHLGATKWMAGRATPPRANQTCILVNASYAPELTASPIGLIEILGHQYVVRIGCLSSIENSSTTTYSVPIKVYNGPSKVKYIW